MRRSSSFLAGVSALGFFTWEIFANGNIKRWQVWSVLPAATFWIWLGILQFTGHDPWFHAHDPSWWVIGDFILCPLSLIPYALFRIAESTKK